MKLSSASFFLFAGLILQSCNVDPPTVTDTFVEIPVSGEGIDCSQEVSDIFNPESNHIIVFGDVQSYVNNESFMDYFYKSAQGIRKEYLSCAPVSCILYVGDLTEDNSIKQWERFNTAFSINSDLILSVCSIGNHDYEWSRTGEYPHTIYNRNLSHFSDYVCSWPLLGSIVARYENGNLENIVVEDIIEGRGIDLLVMEYSPRQDVIDWAAGYVTEHPERSFIIMTHEMLNNELGLNKSSGDLHFLVSGLDHSSPKELWERVCFPNDNVIAVLCGHNGFSSHIFKSTRSGKQTPIILFNLQYCENGGNGMVEIWEFPEGSREVNVRIVDMIHRTEIDSIPTVVSFQY